MTPSVKVLSGSNWLNATTAEPLIVNERSVIVSVTATAGHSVLIDGERLSIETAGTLLKPLILNESVGFHRIQVGERTYWLGNTDSKLRLEGLESMLSYLRGRAGRSWSGQMLFSNGSGLRDPQVVYSWLDASLPDFIVAAKAIARAPSRDPNPSWVSRNPGAGGRVSIPRTIRMLRQSPSDLLEPMRRGPVTANGVDYGPRKVVVQTSTPSVRTLPNLRVTWLLLQLSRLVREVARASPDGVARQRVDEWRLALARLRRVEPFSSLADEARDGSSRNAARSTVESAGPYAISYNVACDLAKAGFGWVPNVALSDRYGYVRSIDLVYQGFAAVALAEALDLRPTSTILGKRQPAFSNPQWRMYYDCVPPSDVLQTWRGHTSIPDQLRPDILLVSEDGRVVLVDAKYRSSGTETTESARRDMESYMSAYGLDKAVILYPNIDGAEFSVRRAEYGERELVEVSVQPAEGLNDHLMSQMPVLLGIARKPSYTP